MPPEKQRVTSEAVACAVEIYLSALTVATNSIPDSLLLPILQSLHMTALADAMSTLQKVQNLIASSVKD